MGDLRGSFLSIVLNTAWLLHITPCLKTAPRRLQAHHWGHCQHPGCSRALGGQRGARKRTAFACRFRWSCGRSAQGDWAPRETEWQGSEWHAWCWGSCNTGPCDPLLFAPPFNPNPLQASVGSQGLPGTETFKEISKSLPFRDAKVREQKEFTKPLPEPTLSVPPLP